MSDTSITNCGNIKITTPPQHLIDAMRKWGIHSPLERAHFLAQCAHESGNFYYKREIWGPTPTQLRYEGRVDLGNIHPGDGKKYMGRGYIQLTGRSNYEKFNKSVDDDVVTNPELVETKYSGDTACWFWKTRKLDTLAINDTIDVIKSISIKINGKNKKTGLPNGLDDRVKKFCGYWEQIKKNPSLYS
jgi:putative chitinase